MRSLITEKRSARNHYTPTVSRTESAARNLHEIQDESHGREVPRPESSSSAHGPAGQTPTHRCPLEKLSTGTRPDLRDRAMTSWVRRGRSRNPFPTLPGTRPPFVGRGADGLSVVSDRRRRSVGRTTDSWLAGTMFCANGPGGLTVSRSNRTSAPTSSGSGCCSSSGVGSGTLQAGHVERPAGNGCPFRAVGRSPLDSLVRNAPCVNHSGRSREDDCSP